MRTISIPYRGLRCREPSCQAQIFLSPTVRGRTMPLDKDALLYTAASGDGDRGLFVILPETPASARGVAYGIKAALAMVGLEKLPPNTTVYRAHWATCTKADRFRR